jgi:hypothetical protein
VNALETVRRERWNVAAWNELYNESSTSKFRRRDVLRAMVHQFPTSGSFWSKLIKYGCPPRRLIYPYWFTGSYELTRVKPDLDAVDRDLATAMRLTGHANLELWFLEISRALEKSVALRSRCRFSKRWW